MRYDILTVVNEHYSAFGHLFLHSLCDRVNLNAIGSIHVYDTGLAPDTLQAFSRFPKVNLMQSNLCASSRELHDEGWEINTYAKTSFLLPAVRTGQRPTVMIDVDCVFKRDFVDRLDPAADIGVCRRRRDGFSPHIGAFFAATRVETSIPFLERWIARIAATTGKHKESPALSHTLEHSPDLAIQELAEEEVAALHDHEDVCIFHLKSGPGLESIQSRIMQPHLLPYIEPYLKGLPGV